MKRMAYDSVSELCTELHLIVKAGIPLDDGVKLLMESEKASEARAVLKEIADNMDEGSEFFEAIRNTGRFDEYMCEMVEIGVKTGYQEEVFKSLSEFYESQYQINRNIRNAIAYPSILIVMLLLVVAILVTQVLPIFGNVYSQLGSEMPAAAGAIMNAGKWISARRVFVLIILLVLVGAGVILAKYPSLRRKLFAEGRNPDGLSGKVAVARLTLGLSMTMHSGLDTSDSLTMVKQLTENIFMRRRIDACKELVDSGEPFAAAVTRAQLLPRAYSRILEIGVRTGKTDAAMEEIARRSEMEATSDIERVIGLIEPTLVVIMSVFIGAILLAVMLPLTGIMSAL